MKIRVDICRDCGQSKLCLILYDLKICRNCLTETLQPFYAELMFEDLKNPVA